MPEVQEDKAETTGSYKTVVPLPQVKNSITGGYHLHCLITLFRGPRVNNAVN